MSTEPKIVYCTKYCIPSGEITECELIEVGEGNRAIVKWPGALNGINYLASNDWHHTREQAESRFSVMLKSKRRSLEKQLGKIEDLEDSGPKFVKSKGGAE